MSREFNRPTDDPRRILRNFDVELRQTLLHALAVDRLRIEKIPPRPWPFPDNLFPEVPVPPHLDVLAPGQTTFIALVLVDLEGNPVPGARYRLTPPSGIPSEGTLDSEGKARVDGMDPGSCKIEFLDFDAADFS